MHTLLRQRSLARALSSAALLLAGLVGPASAQTWTDKSGSVVPAMMPLPYQYTPMSGGQYGLSATTPTALNVAPGARYAVLCAETATVRYTTSGTAPTSALGMPLAAGSCVTLSGVSVIASFRALSATGTLDVEYFQ